MAQQDERKNRKWCAIVLAAGYGTRLAKDIIESGDHSLAPLVNLPKPLLPICNVPLLDYWLNIFRKQSDIISDVMVVTNQKFYSQLLHWASTRGLPSSNIVNDGSFSNDSRLGAACDINLIINSKQSIIQGNDVFIVAGDTLFYEDFDLRTFLQSIPDGCGGTVYYDISNPEERSKRGIIEIDTLTNKIINFLEKPNVNETDSTKACPACYSYPSNYYNMIPSFISETADLPLEARDAPGKLLSWFLLKQNAEIYSHKISGRFDIGSLQDYIHTTNHFNHNLYKKTLTLPKYVEQLCYARVGLLGNPSDGFHGKTISFSLENFYATVTITSPTNESDTTIELVPHPIYDRSKYKSLDNLLSSTLTNGYYGGLRLLQATCNAFASRCIKNGIVIHMQRGFQMSYYSNIPQRVGMSGSSAIIVAAFKALMQYFGLTLEDLNLNLNTFPQQVLDIELVELGIAAGLQDRVIQTRGGFVHMDFSEEHFTSFGTGVYTDLDKSLLPKLYVAFNIDVASDSGKVHSTVRSRWQRGDKDVRDGMQALAHLVDEALQAIHEKDYLKLSQLMDQNFALRRQMYGDDVIGQANLKAIAIANKFNLSAKFTGSGGAIVCLNRSAEGDWLSDVDEESCALEMQKEGFKFIRVAALTC